MISEDKQREVYELINQLTQSKKLELVELKIGVQNKDVFIQVLADRPQGGIGIEECTDLNRSIVEAIDKVTIFSEDGYSLEVSSPGLDRPLMTSKDFLRNLNTLVRVLLKEKIAGKGEYQGVVKSVTDHDVTLLTAKENMEIVVPI